MEPPVDGDCIKARTAGSGTSGQATGAATLAGGQNDASEPVTHAAMQSAGPGDCKRIHAQSAATSVGHVISLTGVNATPQSDVAAPTGKLDCQVGREMTGQTQREGKTKNCA